MKNFFKDKKIRYGTFSTVTAIVVICLLVVINLVIGELDYKFDLTSAATYSIGEKSEQVLKNLSEDITVYTMFKTGNSDSIISRVEKVIDQYAKYKHIYVENKDIYLYPDFAKKYATEEKNVGLNSIIVVKGDKYRVIDYSEYFDQSTGVLNVESCLTSAITFVGLEENPVIYAITGHGEIEPENFTQFYKQAQLANYQFKTINLLENDIPSDCSILLATTSYRDYSQDEVTKIKDYLTNDGRLLFVASDVNNETHPKMLSVINAYGVDLEKNYVMEGAESDYMMYPFAVIPQLSEHSINTSLKSGNYKTLAYGSCAINTLQLKKQGLQIENVLTSTNNAYIKADGNASPNVEDGDKTGVFTLASAITDSTYTDKSHTTKIMVVGSFYMLDAQIDEMVNGGNTTFLVNCLNWLNDSEDSVYIAPKSLSSEKIVIDNGTAGKIKLMAWGVIPGIIFLIGFIVCLKRHNG